MHVTACRLLKKIYHDHSVLWCYSQKLELSSFSLQAIGFDLTDVASVFEIPGLYNLLKKGILSYISQYLVLPNMLTFSLSDAVTQEKLKIIEPKVSLHLLMDSLYTSFVSSAATA